MPDVPAAIGSILTGGETVCAMVPEVKAAWAYVPAFRPFADVSEPSLACSLWLTNRRLLVLHYDPMPRSYAAKPPPKPYVYSAATVHGLSERQFSDEGSFPYQALLYLPSGLVLVLETVKQDMATRGRELSAFLNLAFAQLGGQHGDDEGLASRRAHEIEQERRRRND